MRREAPHHIIWGLICPDTGGYGYNIKSDLEWRREAPPF